MENKELKTLENKQEIKKPASAYKYWIILIIAGILFLISAFTIKTTEKVNGIEVVYLYGVITKVVDMAFGVALFSVGLTLYLIGDNKEKHKEYELSLKDNQK